MEKALIYAAAVVVAGIGLLLLMRGFWGDRSHGRRRCPRCWYDMASTSSRACSECGVEAPSEKALLRDRRRWRLVILGILLCVLAGAASLSPWAMRKGWYGSAPTTVLLFQYDLMIGLGGPAAGAGPGVTQGEVLLAELDKRMDSMWKWQRRYFARALIRRLAGGATPEMPFDQVQIIQKLSPEVGAAEKDLRAMLQSPKAPVRAKGRTLIAYGNWHAAGLVPDLRAVALDATQDPAERHSALNTLRIVATCDAWVTLAEVARDPSFSRGGFILTTFEFSPSFSYDMPCSLLAYWMHRRLQEVFQPDGPFGESTSTDVPLPTLEKGLKDPDASVRFRAVMALMAQEFGSPGSVAALERALTDSDEIVRYAAVAALGSFEYGNYAEGWKKKEQPPPVAENAGPAIISALKDDSPLVRSTAAWSLGWIHPLQPAAVDPLAALLKDSDVLVRRQAALALARLWTGAPEAAARLAPALDDSDSVVRVNAARALIRSGDHYEKARTVLEAAFDDPGDLAGLRADLLVMDSLIPAPWRRNQIAPPDGVSVMGRNEVLHALREKATMGVDELFASGETTSMEKTWATWLRAELQKDHPEKAPDGNPGQVHVK